MKRIKINWSATLGALAAAGCCLAFGTTPAQSQEKYPTWPNEAMYDEVKAASDFYKVRFEDNHIRLVEVTIPPGAKTPMHGDPYPTVIAADGALPKITETPMDPKARSTDRATSRRPRPMARCIR